MERLVADYDFPIEIIYNRAYEEIQQSLSLIASKITTENFILCKGDIFFRDQLQMAYQRFAISNDDMHAFVYEAIEDEPVMSIDSNDYLCGYNSEYIPFRSRNKILMTVNYALFNFYICKSELLTILDGDFIGCKEEIIPFYIRKMKRIKLQESINFQIATIDCYMKQLNFIEDSEETSNLIEENTEIHHTSNIKDSVIGEDCRIGVETHVWNSVIIGDTYIGSYCDITESLIGFGVEICDGCVLNRCRVGNNYVFETPVNAVGVVFNIEDPIMP